MQVTKSNKTIKTWCNIARQWNMKTPASFFFIAYQRAIWCCVEFYHWKRANFCTTRSPSTFCRKLTIWKTVWTSTSCWLWVLADESILIAFLLWSLISIATTMFFIPIHRSCQTFLRDRILFLTLFSSTILILSNKHFLVILQLLSLLAAMTSYLLSVCFLSSSENSERSI